MKKSNSRDKVYDIHPSGPVSAAARIPIEFSLLTRVYYVQTRRQSASSARLSYISIHPRFITLADY